ncbi:MAG: DedA family protein [Proteobacteria bacterium]|nr:DedA family protein [Pseudomonadota bacterium]
MLRSLYDRTMRLAAHPHAVWWLALVSFLESSIFPIPPDVLLIPMALADRRRAFWYAGVCTGASVLGGWAGYAIGYELFEVIGRPIINVYGLQDQFAVFQHTFNEYGAWIVLIKGLTPIPYKLITITAGVTHLDLVTFSIASAISRGGRFFLVVVLLWYFGEPIRTFIERYLTWVTTGVVAAVIGGFVVLRFV